MSIAEFYPIREQSSDGGKAIIDALSQTGKFSKPASIATKWLAKSPLQPQYGKNIAAAKKGFSDFGYLQITETFGVHKLMRMRPNREGNKFKEAVKFSVNLAASSSLVLTYAHNTKILDLGPFAKGIAAFSNRTYFRGTCITFAEKVEKARKKQTVESAIDATVSLKKAIFAAAFVFPFKIPAGPGLVLDTFCSAYVMGKGIVKKSSTQDPLAATFAECRLLGMKKV